MISVVLLWVRRNWLVSVLVVSVIIIIYGVFFRNEEKTIVEPVSTPPPRVQVTSAAAEAGDITLSLIGTVRPFSEASITAESAGRIVSVPVQLGQFVAAGAVIAQLENADARAAFIQAEGSYEAALAATSQSVQQNDSNVRNAEIAIKNAENAIITAIQTSFATANNTLVATVDQFYSNPLGLNPGIRIGGTDTSYLRNERIAFQDIIKDWRSDAEDISYDASSLELLQQSETYTERLLLVVDHLIAASSRADRSDQLNGQLVTSLAPILITERNALVAALQTIRTARTTLTQAEESLALATISDTSVHSALTDAQVKQALGALEAARANLAKTTLRTPIAGTVNSLTIRTGDFTSTGVTVATVANNESLEVIAYVDSSQRERITIGDEVRIETVATGTVMAISPGVDSVTRKIEVRISLPATAGVAVGETVRVRTIEQRVATSSPMDPMYIPLTAVQFQADAGAIFTIDELNRLRQIPVTLGEVRGSRVAVTGDITWDTEFVADARGFRVGDEVMVAK